MSFHGFYYFFEGNAPLTKEKHCQFWTLRSYPGAWGLLGQPDEDQEEGEKSHQEGSYGQENRAFSELSWPILKGFWAYPALGGLVVQIFDESHFST